MTKGVHFRFSATNAAAPAMRQFQQNLGRVQNQMKRQSPLQRSWNAGLNSNRRAVQQFGFQMSDFAIQIAGGQSAMLAFTQQGGQMLQFFGPAGSLAAAFVAVFGSLAIAFTRSGKALSDLFPLMGVLQDEFRTLGNALVVVKERMLDFTNLVVNNLDVLLISATVLTGFFVGKWVAAFVVASGVVGSLTKILRILITTLRRTFIGAVLVGMGYVIERFLALRKVIGSSADTLRLLALVWAEQHDKMVLNVIMLAFRFYEKFYDMKATALRVIADIIGSWQGGLVDRMISVMIAAVKAITAALETLPSAMKNIAIRMMNNLIDRIESGMGGVIDAINAPFEFLNMPTIPAPDLSGWRGVENEVGSVMGAVRQAIDEGLNTSFFDDVSNAITGMANEASATSGTFRVAGDAIAGYLERTGSPWTDKFAEIFSNLKEETIDVRDWFNSVGDAAEEGAGRSARAIKDTLTPAMQRLKDVQDAVSTSLENALMSVVDGTKSLKDSFRTMASEIIKELYRIFVVKQITGFITDAIGGLFGGGVTTSMRPTARPPSFAGGGYTGSGSRTGGMDGKGGFMAMLHPNETVVDHARGGSSGMTVNVSVNVQAEDPRAVEAALSRAMPRMIEATKAAVADGARRGGSFGRAFG